MDRSNARTTAVLSFVLAIAAPVARASDWYVDAASGADTNGGTSPVDAWRTVTHALATVPDPPTGQNHTIHVAPGTYDVALGETFPLVMRPALQLVGDAGSGSTTIDATGAAAAAVFDFTSDAFDDGHQFGPDTTLEGFSIVSGIVGVDLFSNWNPVSPTLRDLSISGQSGAGILAATSGVLFLGFVGPTLEGVRVSSSPRGLHVLAGDSTTGVVVTASDCAFSGNSGNGIEVDCGESDVSIVVARCRLESNGADGVFARGDVLCAVSDSLVAGNGDDGLESVSDAGSGATSDLQVVRSTVASNAGSGVRAAPGTGCPSCEQFVTLEGTLVFGNGDDVDFTGTFTADVSYSDVGDGDHAGSNGNFSADPLFVDAPAGDYRLSIGSPCAEAGNPATPTGTIDLAGVARDVDGNFDGVEAPDVGAYELAPLFLVGAPAIATTVALETFGPAGGVSLLLAAAGLPVATPISTPFGEFDLNPIAAVPVGVVAVAPGPPATLPIMIPNNPLLVGLSISFQGFTVSGLAFPPAAFTNAVAIEFE